MILPLAFATALLMGGLAPAAAVPAVPASDDVVLERLPEARDPPILALKRSRALLRAAPQDLRIATAHARRAIDAARATGDPRYLGQAQAALAPWWSAADAPAPALLLRATIKQSQHDFDGALADLDRLLERAPADVQARLTRATVLGVVGRHDGARADCERLAGAVPPLVAIACSASIDGVTSRAAAAEAALVTALARDAGSPAVRVWALTIAGDVAGAEARFRDALALDPADAYLLGAFADLMIDAGRAAEAVRLLDLHRRHDALLLRLVIAQARLGAPPGRHAADRAELAARFEATRRRGDTVHRREEARYALALEGDARRAVGLARANFAVQKEPSDLRVLVEAARAADDARALATAQEWLASTGLRDARLDLAGGSRS